MEKNKMPKSKKLKFKKLPYEASYKTLLKRFPEIKVEEEKEMFLDEPTRQMMNCKLYEVNINGEFWEKYGLCYHTESEDHPLETSFAWGTEERFMFVQKCAKFIYLITEHFKNCHFITPRDIVDWGVAHKPISDEEKYEEKWLRGEID
tara:strand:- start:108 stop:551 length:444 start_codon:yes stop_codon:yes gene_type:complete